MNEQRAPRATEWDSVMDALHALGTMVTVRSHYTEGHPAIAQADDNALTALARVLETIPDLVVALVSETLGAPRRWLVISPVLGTVVPYESRLSLERPRWLEGDLGIEVADSRIGGAARVVRVIHDGPGARAGVVVGERILEIAGRPIDSVRAFRDAIDAPSGAGPIPLRVEGHSGAGRAIQVERRLRARSEDVTDDARAAVAAAWARVDAVALPADDAAAALANLATLLGRAGRHRESAATWDAVLALGSTLSVFPAASIPMIATERGTPYIIVNQGPTNHDDHPGVTLRLEGDVTDIVPPAVEIALA